VTENRLFVSSSALDGWVLSGQADLLRDELRLRNGNRYQVEEAAHVLSEVTGSGDAHGLVGRVVALRELATLGAEVLDRSMVIGDLAYDVVSGFLARPAEESRVATASALAVLRALSATAKSAPPAQTDEELLARYLIQRL
jgi:hypothetical protein